MMDLDEDMSLSVKTCLLKFIQVFFPVCLCVCVRVCVHVRLFVCVSEREWQTELESKSE